MRAAQSGIVPVEGPAARHPDRRPLRQRPVWRHLRQPQRLRARRRAVLGRAAAFLERVEDEVEAVLERGRALRDVSLVVRPGEIVAVVGPSGAGKSTLAHLLVRFADPQGGQVRLDGIDLREVTLGSLRRHVGLLLQDTYLPDVSARVAIAQGREGAGDDEIERAARAAGVHEALEALPDGYETRIGPGGSRVSGGQRRRLAIARAFVRDTPVLILDEPTTGLDGGARDRLLEPLQALARGRTTILISHDPAVVGWADRVIELRDGALVPAPAATCVRSA